MTGFPFMLYDMYIKCLKPCVCCTVIYCFSNAYKFI